MAATGPPQGAGQAGGTRHQHIRACLYNSRRRIDIDPAIDFHFTIQILLTKGIPDLANFAQRFGNKFLAAEAGIYRHDQHQLQARQHFGDHHRRCAGIQRHAGLLAQGVRSDDRFYKGDGGIIP